MNRAAVRAAEHLKAWVSEVLDKYHEGCINGAEAKLSIWDEIQTTLSSVKPKHFEDLLWARVQVPDGDPELARLMFEVFAKDTVIVSARYLGPQEGSDYGVFYVAASAGNIHKAAEVVDCLVNEGFHIRDWTFGSNRR